MQEEYGRVMSNLISPPEEIVEHQVQGRAGTVALGLTQSGKLGGHFGPSKGKMPQILGYKIAIECWSVQQETEQHHST